MTTSEAVVLPTTVLPRKYRLTLKPDFTSFTFEGSESVVVQVAEPTSEIVLNAIDLGIASASIQQSGSSTAASSITYDEERQTASLGFSQNIAAGAATLDIVFTGVLNDRLHGFYRSEYTNPEGEQSYLATTQFEATDARRAFPCWDEPAHKASFEVTLVIPSDLVAVSNTPIVEETEPEPGLKSITFGETPVMSTYLLAFVVGDLVGSHQQANERTEVGVWTTRGKEDQGEFALDTSVKLLSFFNDYFGIPYPLEKLDHIAIPDFAAGAMENWGAITYRETALLVDQANSSAGTRQRVAEVVAHEMAHMWFGDLVTMAWWDDLWLNESFASWMGSKAVDWLFPEWDMWTQFVNMDTNRALSLDGLKNSHPIEQEVKDPAEVSQLFDAISYSKGASVIRMLEQFLGPETFQQGLQRYLSAHLYGNARTEDLWSALETTSGQPVTSIMDSWTKQMGYPVLRVETSESGGNLDLTLHQERFVYDRLEEETEPEPEVWQVPVGVSSGGASDTSSMVMDSRQANLRVAAPSTTGAEEGWFKVNPDQTGFFRVNYSQEDWERLVPAIRQRQLPATDRLGIQNDAYALSRAGLLPVSQFLTLASAYENEDDASVWSDLASNLHDINSMLADEPTFEAFQRFARELFAPAARRSGWEPRAGEGHLDALLRTTVISQAGSYGDGDVLSQAMDRFHMFLEDRDKVRPDLRGVVFSLAGQAGGETTYRQLWDLKNKAPIQEEEMRLLLGLSRFSQPELLSETLERTLTTDVRSQDTISVVTAVAANTKGRELAWQFLKDNWEEFDRRYGGGGFGLMRLVSICGHFNDESRIEEVEEFFRGHPAPAGERTIRQALERVRLNSRWLDRNRSALSNWFGS